MKKRKSKHEKKAIENLIREGCIEMAEDCLKITKEFEAIEDFKDWEGEDK